MGHWPTRAWSWGEKKQKWREPAGVFIEKITWNLRIGTGTETGPGTGTVDEKFGDPNRNLGKMAQFHNTGLSYAQ